MAISDHLSVRYLMVSLIVISAVVIYITRQDLNMALVSMCGKNVKDDNVTQICPVKDYREENVWTTTTIDPLRKEPSKHLRDKKYNWSQSTQGYIFGGFFWSYIIFQVFTGMLVQKHGGYPLVVVSLLASAVISGITPFVTDHVWLLIVLRVVLGCFQAGFFPAGFDVICKWTPLKERSVCFALLDLGSTIGTILIFYTTGYIDKTYGWPSLFFIPCIIASAVFVLVALGLRSTPDNCSFVSEKEVKVINQDVKEDRKDLIDGEIVKKSDLKTPFVKILTTKAVIAAGIFKFSLSFAYTVFSSKVPVYLDRVIHEDLELNGHVNAYINVIVAASLLFAGYLSDFVLNRKYMPRTRTRKCFAIVSGFGNAACIISIPWTGCDASKLHAILYLDAVCTGFAAGSDLPIPSEMSLNFPAVLYAMLNMAAMSSGFVAPAFAGLLLDNIKNQWLAWCILYYSTGGLLIFSTIVFMIYGSAERQSFDFVAETAGKECEISVEGLVDGSSIQSGRKRKSIVNQK